MGLSCICLDCGRQFYADHHTDQCGPCWERDTEIFKNVPPIKGAEVFVRRRRPSPDYEPRPAAPIVNIAPDGHVNYGVGPCAVDRNHTGPFVSRIGRALLCHACAREADAVALGVGDQRRSA